MRKKWPSGGSRTLPGFAEIERESMGAFTRQVSQCWTQTESKKNGTFGAEKSAALHAEFLKAILCSMTVEDEEADGING